MARLHALRHTADDHRRGNRRHPRAPRLRRRHDARDARRRTRIEPRRAARARTHAAAAGRTHRRHRGSRQADRAVPAGSRDGNARHRRIQHPRIGHLDAFLRMDGRDSRAAGAEVRRLHAAAAGNPRARAPARQVICDPHGCRARGELLPQQVGRHRAIARRSATALMDMPAINATIDAPTAETRALLFAHLANSKAAVRAKAAEGLLKLYATARHRGGLARDFGTEPEAILKPWLDELRELIGEPKSEAWTRFVASLEMDMDKWRDGTGYDLAALREMK